MAARKQPWAARLTGWGHRLTKGGGKAVYLQARIIDPEKEANRVIYIEITPELARHLADGLERNAQQADEHNDRRRKLTDRGETP
jgi:hypothetical protein